MLKFLKTTVAEDVIITEEALVVLAVEVLPQEEKEVLLQEEKDLADLEATEDLLLEKVVLDQEVNQEALQLQGLVVFHQTEGQGQKVHLIELQDVLKTLVMHRDQEDQEETNKSFC